MSILSKLKSFNCEKEMVSIDIKFNTDDTDIDIYINENSWRVSLSGKNATIERYHYLNNLFNSDETDDRHIDSNRFIIWKIIRNREKEFITSLLTLISYFSQFTEFNKQFSNFCKNGGK